MSRFCNEVDKVIVQHLKRLKTGFLSVFKRNKKKPSCHKLTEQLLAVRCIALILQPE
jgi:hypothetical protein